MLLPIFMNEGDAILMQLVVFWVHLLFLNPSGDLSEVCILAEWSQEINAHFLDWDFHAKCLGASTKETEANVKVSNELRRSE